MHRTWLHPGVMAASALLTSSVATAAGTLAPAAQYAQNLTVPTKEAVAKAGRFLLERQGAWPAGEGRIVLDGWEWLVGSGQGAPNIAGLVALGLVEAFEATGDKTFLEAARTRGRLVRAQLKRGEHVYAADVELVARLARLNEDTGAFALARRGLQARLEKGGGAEAEARRIIGLRRATPDLAGYDIAMLADAALAVEQPEIAHALVRAALQYEKQWLKESTSTFGLISAGALLATSSRLHDDASARALAVSLLAVQQEDGAWRARETQATSYATRGLAVFARVYSDASAAKAAAKGRDWLRLTQLRSGAWADYNDYLPEPFVGEVFSPATAEALRAVVAAR